MKWPCAAAAAAIVVLRVAILPWLPVPEPRTHDEFAYLLGAETFLAGRLTNPVHPMWTHFETFHVNMVPSYQMKYPPAQSLSLALGTALFGHPWAGVVMTAAGMAAALCWALRAWFPPGWAFGVTVAAMVLICLTSYWMNSYWGGTVAAAAGALVTGAAVRFARTPGAWLGMAAAAGAAVLAASRPFEGALFCGMAGVATIVELYRGRRGAGLGRLLAPAAAIGLASVAALAFYNYRSTGHPALFAYQEHQRQYAASPVLLFQRDVEIPFYRHEVMRKFWEWDRGWYLWAKANPWFSSVSLLRSLAFFTPLPLGLAFVWGIRRHPWTGGVLLAFFAVLCLERWLIPHYLAPAVAAIVLLTAFGLREMDRRLAAALLAITAVLRIGTWTPGIYSGYGTAFVEHRRQVLERLATAPGRHLVFVRYGPRHDGSDEWVYNSADIDRSPVVWAREMNPEQDSALEAYYPDRRIWLLEADARPPRLTPSGRSRESASPGSSN